MVDRTELRKDLDVVGSDGETIGRIDAVEGDRIKLTRNTSPDGQHHYVDIADVARVDGKVHLSKTRAAVLGVAAAATGAGAASGANIGGARSVLPEIRNPTVESANPRRNYLLPWVLGAIALLALILLLTQCGRHDNDAKQTTTTTTTQTTQRYAGAPIKDGTLAYDLDRFLSSTDGTPRTFTFDKLNFDSGKATIRGEDKADLDDIARVFAAYPTARAAIIGYTDAKGSPGANGKLGGERAQAVIAALQQRGADPSRFEARSGGQNDPVATNASGEGRFENRRTELVVLKR